MTTKPWVARYGVWDPSPRGRWSARLVNEDDPCGPVLLYSDTGTHIEMPLELFRQIREDGKRKSMQYTGASVVTLPPTLAHLKP